MQQNWVAGTYWDWVAVKLGRVDWAAVRVLANLRVRFTTAQERGGTSDQVGLAGSVYLEFG